MNETAVLATLYIEGQKHRMWIMCAIYIELQQLFIFQFLTILRHCYLIGYLVAIAHICLCWVSFFVKIYDA
jgi:hypothetical protein